MDWRGPKLPFVMEIPGLLIQIAGIATLLTVTYGDTTATLFAIIVSQIWLSIPPSQSVEQVWEWRARRQLFGKLGEWLGREDAYQEFDAVLSRTSGLNGNIEDPQFGASMIAQATAGLLRGATAVLIHLYLLATIVLVIW